MKKVYVVMKQRHSPIAITSAIPHQVCMTKDVANARVKELNKKAQQNYYWVESVDLVNGETK